MHPFGIFWGKGMFDWSYGPFLWLLPPLILWSLFWKGLALWRAAQGKQLGWFIFLLVLNTAGILEIVYLIFFAKDKLKLGSKKRR